MSIEEDTQNRNTAPASTLKDVWSIRPCSVYKDEYDDCTSIKARFHQYFIFGENTDCTQWKKDFDNCERYKDSNGNDVAAGEALIQSEAERRRKRLEAHYGNTTWTKRKQPPEDWCKPLPEWLLKKNENTYLEIKQKELDGHAPAEEPGKTYCAIM